jgi:hypothetical protein
MMRTAWDNSDSRHDWWRETARRMTDYARYYREEYEISKSLREAEHDEIVQLRKKLTEANDLLVEAGDVIDGLVDQQAMDDSWWRPIRIKIRVYLKKFEV